MPGRSYGSMSKYGFNGHERSDELNNDLYTSEFAEYDSRIGRRWNVDPLAAKMPGWSPYVYAFDNPVLNIDKDGLWGEDGRGKFYNQMGTAAIKDLIK